MDFMRKIGITLLILGFFCAKDADTARVPDIKIDKSSALSGRKIALSWTPNFIPKRGQLEYVVRYKVKGKSGSQREQVNKPEITLKGLEPGSTYVINVRAVNGKDRGDWSDTINVKTHQRKGTAVPAEAELSVKHVIGSSAELVLNLTGSSKEESDIQEYLLVVKTKDYINTITIRPEGKSVYTYDVTNLEPETAYIANAFILYKQGTRKKIGSTRFKTLEVQIDYPKNVRPRSVTDTSVTLKWKRINDVDGYVVQYAPSSVLDNAELCTTMISNRTKWFKARDLLPNTDYYFRVTGTLNGHFGVFSEWTNVTTTSLRHNSDVIDVFDLSPQNVLIKWENVERNNVNLSIKIIHSARNVEIPNRNIQHIENSGLDDYDIALVSGLLPKTDYHVIISYDVTCPKNKVTTLRTPAGDYIERNVEQNLFDAKLRLFQLPDMTYFLTWSQLPFSLENETYITVIRILGEPFLHPVSMHYIPPNTRYLHLTELNTKETYSMDLMVFKAGNGTQPDFFQKIVVTPRSDDGIPEMTSFGTSMDYVTETLDSEVSDALFNGTKTPLSSVHKVQVSNVTVLSIDGLDSVQPTSGFFASEKPMVTQKSDVTVTIMTSLDLTCVARGDFFPDITWKRLPSDENVSEKETESQSITITSVRHVGIDKTTGATFMYTKSFLSFDPVLADDETNYKCEASNLAGKDATTFSLIVHPKPPGPVRNLQAITTPFQVTLRWAEPIVESRDPRGVVKVYHVLLLDETDYLIHQENTSKLDFVFKTLTPQTNYRGSVSAYSSIAKGLDSYIAFQTLRIPTLGPALNVTITTLNGTTMAISWLPPKYVQDRFIRLRGYIFLHRKFGKSSLEEMRIDKEFTNISVISLEPEEQYEVSVVSLSEDGQVSYSPWVLGNTTREAYMNESVPPPPPHNVYLNHEVDNIIVTWLPPKPDENILVRGYVIDVLHNKTRRETMKVGYKESSVMVYEVEMGVSYQISVRTFNNAGTSVNQFEELYVPRQYVTQDPVENFRGEVLSSTQLKLFWDPPATGLFNRFVMSYTITDDVRPELPGTGNFQGSVRSFDVRSLEPYTEYVFNITPYLRNLEGTTTNTTIRTFSDKPSGVPENVTLTVINSTAILVKALAPSQGKNGIIEEYRISYRKGTDRGSVLVEATEEEELNYFLTGLDSATVYEIRTRALTVNGSGPWSDWLQEKTKPREPVMPKVPRNLTTSATSHAITLSWLPPDQPIKEITGYVVGYGRFIPEVFRKSISSKQTECTIKNLDGESVYIVSVRSFNDFGESAAEFELVTTL